MKLSLSLQNFRSYTHCAFSLDTWHVGLWGDNGAGKTNCLEALSLFAPGRGFHRSSLTHMAKRGSPTWSVRMTYEDSDGPLEFQTLTLENQPQKRQIYRNQVPLKTQWSLQEDIQILWSTPAMQTLFSHTSSVRRDAFHRFISTVFPEYGPCLTRYLSAMRERMRGLMDPEFSPLWLESLEHQMAQCALKIGSWQKEWSRRMNILVTDHIDTAFSQPMYHLPQEKENLSAQDYQQKLCSMRFHDRKACKTLWGVHRHNIEVYHPQGSEAKDTSSGQQKSLLLSTILGLAWWMSCQKDKISLLLLDDVMAHLDGVHREALLAEVKKLSMHVWMTGTDQSFFQSLEPEARWCVREGTVQR